MPHNTSCRLLSKKIKIRKYKSQKIFNIAKYNYVPSFLCYFLVCPGRRAAHPVSYDRSYDVRGHTRGERIWYTAALVQDGHRETRTGRTGATGAHAQATGQAHCGRGEGWL